MPELIPGKRYSWNINNKKRNALFTGMYYVNNGNAILMSKKGETWSIPKKELKEYKKEEK